MVPLSAPIIRVSLEELRDPARLSALRSVLQYWVTADAYNGALRRVHILRFRMPDRYRVNQVPTKAGLVEQGRIRLSEGQLAQKPVLDSSLPTVTYDAGSYMAIIGGIRWYKMRMVT